jgi:starch phosphorylase
MKKDSLNIRSGKKPEELKQAILDNLYYVQGKSAKLATLNDWYMALAYTVRDRMMHNWVHNLERFADKDLKVVGYLSAEFLMGPHLGNALINLGIFDEVKLAAEQLGLDLHKVMAQEEEPGLGNGGLGRLAACYLDSLTTLNVAAIGYGIRYEFGIFDQEIKDGWQVEITDLWLRPGNPWEIVRPELNYYVKFGGHTESRTDVEGNLHVDWIPEYEVKGVAYDTPVPGYKNDSVNRLRLWKSEAVESFDFHAFNKGDYYGAVDEKVFSENISKILYPNDEQDSGKKLRLSQQYFFVTCSLQDVIRLHKSRGLSLDLLHESTALQLNDTHPSIAVAELMRLLVDENEIPWVKAWTITQKTLGYTNHTVLPEALEKWSLPLFAELLPRHLEIIYEINHRFLEEVRAKFPFDEGRVSRMSIIDEHGERYVRMAHLASVGSHAINGVSELHSELLKRDVLRDFYELTPEKFLNVTNGVTPRRWVKLTNPKFADLITQHIGERWLTHLEDDLPKLEKFIDDKDFQQAWRRIKAENKDDLAKLIRFRTGVVVNPDSLFDIQVKRFHEYKRQHLNLLHIVTLYNRVRKNPKSSITPRTFIFGGKAAPGYFMAKLIIKLINSVGEVVNNDKDVAGRLKVAFIPDFNVKNSELVYRAAELSEQISLAGKEASGTGNMKFSMNGALTIGTFDGANIEILEEVGSENFFLFGLTADQVHEVKSQGYQPGTHYANNPELREVIDLIQSGVFSKGDKNLFKPIIDSLLYHDPYLLLADYPSYIECQENVSETYKDQTKWTKMSILNVARMGKFSSDRSIRDYCKNVWDVEPAERNAGKTGE